MVEFLRKQENVTSAAKTSTPARRLSSNRTIPFPQQQTTANQGYGNFDTSSQNYTNPTSNSVSTGRSTNNTNATDDSPIRVSEMYTSLFLTYLKHDSCNSTIKFSCL